MRKGKKKRVGLGARTTPHGGAMARKKKLWVLALGGGRTTPMAPWANPSNFFFRGFGPLGWSNHPQRPRRWLQNL
jgi:hypothetical protein